MLKIIEKNEKEKNKNKKTQECSTSKVNHNAKGSTVIRVTNNS